MTRVKEDAHAAASLLDMPALRNAIAMSVVLRALGPEPHDVLTSAEEDGLLASARLLRDAAASGGSRSLLRDKFIGLLAEDDDGENAELFKSAAVGLGARVAHIRPSLTERSDPQVVRETARMLGRLYDAIECHGQPPALVARLVRDLSNRCRPLYASHMPGYFRRSSCGPTHPRPPPPAARTAGGGRPAAVGFDRTRVRAAISGF